jgi:hypothetical protein
MVIKSQRDYMPLFLEKVASGNYLVPKFQRDFVWSTKQIVDLFDSIIKGFPIGSIIMWKPDGEEFDTIRNVGGIRIKPAETEVSYILDGRQRITAMMSVLYKDGDYTDGYYIDLEDFTIVKQGRGSVPPNYLKLSDAFDSWYIVEYIENIKRKLEPEVVREYSEKAKKINKQLLSYEIGYITVYGGKIDEAVEIFSRLNSKGIDITADYMIQALTYNHKSGFLFSDKIVDIIDALSPCHFDNISRDTILKCIYNYTKKPFIDCKTEDIIQMKNLPAVVESVKEDIIATVKFLSEQCEVRDFHLLPYTYQFVMLAMFFKENKDFTEDKISTLKQWFFYTSYSGYFTNTSLANIRKDIEVFRDFCKGKLQNPMKDGKVIAIIDQFPDYLRLGAVRSCSLILSTILPCITQNGDYKRLDFYIPNGLSRERKVGNAICYVNEKQKKQLRDLFVGRGSWNKNLERFYLTEDLMNLYFRGDYKDFEKQRKNMIKEAEKNRVSILVDNIRIF